MGRRRYRKSKVKQERFTFSDDQRREKPRCPYFGKCGGCRYQDVEYSLQVAAKSRWLSELFDRSVEVVPSPEPYGYRNRMDFVFAFGKLGLRERGSHLWVTDLDQCPLMGEQANTLLQRVRELLNKHDIKCFNYLTHQGYLRYLVIRSTRLGETLASFVTYTKSEEILKVIEELQGEATSLYWLHQDSLADVSFGNILQHWGEPVIREKIRGLIFSMGTNTFFQNNAPLIEVVLDDLEGWIGGSVLDLYCGVGCIGLSVAKKAESLLGIESIEESIVLARENAGLNCVENVRFEISPVKEWLHRQRELGFPQHFDTAIVDPPREGLTPKVVRALQRLKPGRILYISCNPSVLKQELELFEEYEATGLKGYDLFPQTPHVEVMAVLERKESHSNGS